MTEWQGAKHKRSGLIGTTTMTQPTRVVRRRLDSTNECQGAIGPWPQQGASCFRWLRDNSQTPLQNVLSHVKSALLYLCVIAVSAGISFAQQAGVSGFVRDPSGAVVPKANVTILKPDTATRLAMSSNEAGFYEFSSLQPGSYELNVDKAGFRSLVRKDLILHIGDRVQIDLTLSIGDFKETVTVVGGAELLNTSDASVSTVVERQTVEQMPLNGRSFQSLLNLMPGVNPINPGAATGQNAQGQFTVDGQRADANYFIVDGVGANTGVGSGRFLGQGGTGSLPGTTAFGGFNGLVSVDALQEFRITTSTFAPEYGRTPGGQILLVTRSGTNAWHGDLFDYFRNTALDANDWFLNRAGLPRGTVHQNDFGGVLGGPIVKDKLFFFLSYEGLRLTNPQAGTSYTFTKDARVLAQQAVNSMNPSYSGYMAQILNAYPLPSHDPSIGDGSTCTSASTCIAPFTKAFPNVSQLDSGSARFDYALNSGTTLFGRYVHSPSSTTAYGSLGSINNTGITLGTDSGTLGLTRTISPTMNNDLRANYTHNGLRESLTAPGFSGTLASLFPAGFAQPPAGLSPNDMLLSFSFLGLGVPDLNIGPAAAHNRQSQFDLVDTLGIVKGSHTLKFGADLRVNDPAVNNAPYNFSAWFYSPLSTPFCLPAGPGPGGPGSGPVGPGSGPGAPLPQFICGKGGSTTVTRNTEQAFRFFNWSLFAQDTWKVTPRLTLTYGLRYEIDPAPHSLNGKPFFSLTNFDPVQCTTTPQFVQGSTICNVGVAPLGTAPYATRWGNLAPRIGVAYQASRNPNWGTVLRAGFGLFYDTANDASSGALGPFSPATGYNPAAASFLPNIPCPSSAVLPPGVTSSGGQYVQFPIANSGCVTPPAIQTIIGPNNPYTIAAQAVAPNLKLPDTYEFNASLQQALGHRQSLTVSYVGARAHDLIGAIPVFGVAKLGAPPVTVPLSPTFPTSLVVYGNYASSNYNALQVYFQRQFYHGLGANASYTWAHSLDDASNFNAGAVYPFSVNYSSSDFDIRQTFAASVVYDAPTPFKRNNLARAVLGHWSFDPIYHYQTAPPINAVAVLNSSPALGFTFTQRPDIIPGVPIYVYGAQCAAEYGSCPGGFGINNAPMGSPLGATPAQASSAGCGPNDTVGAFCRGGTGITPGASSGAGEGNVGRNFLRGFPLRQLDIDVHRDFAAGDRVRIRFEADIFNVFNQTNFASPSAVLTDNHFGTSPSMMNAGFGSGNSSTGGGYNSAYTMGGPRAVQLAIKILF
jgi:hypothetical protein